MSTKSPETVIEVASHGLFGIGDMVTMSELALKQRLQGRKNRRTGVITGYTKRPVMLRVKRMGQNHAETWSPLMWDSLPNAERTRREPMNRI